MGGTTKSFGGGVGKIASIELSERAKDNAGWSRRTGTARAAATRPRKAASRPNRQLRAQNVCLPLGAAPGIAGRYPASRVPGTGGVKKQRLIPPSAPWPQAMIRPPRLRCTPMPVIRWVARIKPGTNAASSCRHDYQLAIRHSGRYCKPALRSDSATPAHKPATAGRTVRDVTFPTSRRSHPAAD